MSAKSAIVSYAQNLEDVRLYRALGSIEAGFYIDAGANHPTRDSVTRLFYDLGWSGINIEPATEWLDALRRERTRDVNLGVAAGATNGEIQLFEFSSSGLSTSNVDFAERHENCGLKRHSRIVPMQTLASICQQYVGHRQIHFLKLDLEGAELAALQGADFGSWRPWVIVAEAFEPNSQNPSHHAWEPILTGARYIYCGADLLNRYYVAEEHSDLAAALSVPVVDYERFELREQTRRLRHQIERMRIPFAPFRPFARAARKLGFQI